MSKPITRRPRSLYETGIEPDPRFSLANERTFLAWTRTSLALLAAGVAIEALQLPINELLRLVAAAVFVILGLMAALQSWIGWYRTERALRHERALPAPSLGLPITIGIVVGIAIVSIGFFLR